MFQVFPLSSTHEALVQVFRRLYFAGEKTVMPKRGFKKAWVSFKCAYCTVETQQPNQFLQELQTDHPKCSVGNSFWESPGSSLIFSFLAKKKEGEGGGLQALEATSRASKRGGWVGGNAGTNLRSPSLGARCAPGTETCSYVGMRDLVGCSGWSCWRLWSDVVNLSPEDLRGIKKKKH